MYDWGSSSVILVYKLRKSYPEVIYYLGILCFNHRKGGGTYEKIKTYGIRVTASNVASVGQDASAIIKLYWFLCQVSASSDESSG
jgi:hypothetical protein